MIKRFTGILLAVCMILSLAACGSSPASNADPGTSSSPTRSQTVYLNYGAGTSGSTINSVVLAHAQIINEYVENVEVSPEASGGGSDNLRLTEDGTFSMSTAGNVAAYDAVNGVGDFQGETFDNVMGWLPAYASYFMLVVPAESSIKSIYDIKGKRVSVGVKGSGAEVYARGVIEGAGLTYDDFTPYYLAQSESNDAIKDGSIDALIYATGVPVPAIMELNAVDDIRIVPIEKEDAEKIAEGVAFFSPGVIPAGTHEGMDEDIPTVQSFTIAFIRADVPEDVVYEMTKAIWEHKDELSSMHASQEHLDPSMIGFGITPVMKLHPGAEKYYKEMGWID